MARILLGVTGGIAAYKACTLVRLLVRAGHDVHPVLTAGAERFVAAETFAALARRPPSDDPYPHLGRFDLLVVAPLTANTLARLAHGLAGDVLTEAALAHSGPVLVAPAMNTRMWQHPATQANVATLRSRGVQVVGPSEGELAEGEEGVGRMAEPEEIQRRIEQLLRPAGLLAGRRVVVSAGGTREPLDAVRYVGNRSSGRMGVALAEEADRRGADVTLLAANVAVPAPAGISLVETPTAADLEREALERADADVIVMAAAVADYRPQAPLRGQASQGRSRMDGGSRADGRRAGRDRLETTGRTGARGVRRRSRRAGVGTRTREAAREERRPLRVQRREPLGHRLRYARQRGRGRLGARRADDREGPEDRGRGGCSRRGGAATLGKMTDAARAEGPVAARSAAKVVERVVENLERSVRAPRATLELCVLCLIAEGHLIIEDFPGVGKTMLAKSVARSLDLSFSRLQFTPDLLPTDVTGVNVFNQRSGEFEFRPGPVFANVLLVDEINRASPKTQSALLEAMQEAQVTIDGETYELELPFFVVATQNPIEYEGTYPLPEAQLDRFTARLSLGYPPHGEEARMLAEQTTSPPLDQLVPVADRDDLLSAIEAARAVYVEESVGHYVVTLVRHTRESSLLALGASPRAGIALLRMAKARAAAHGRDYVVPEDVQSVARAVLSHRVIVAPEARAAGTRGEDAIERALAEAVTPR